MSHENFLLTEVVDSTCWVTFNRSKSLNALNPESIDEINEFCERTQADTSIHAVVFCGSKDGLGKAFIAGADIKRMGEFSKQDALTFAKKGQATFRAIEQLPQVTVAAVNGFALGGGCELALSCDIIYASDRAKFGQPEVHLGIVPGWGGTVRLSRRVGIGKCKEMICSGEMVSADRALQMGLADRVVAADQLITVCREFVAGLKKSSPNAIAAAKRSIQFAANHEEALAYEREAEIFASCFEHHDRKEGIEAFSQKRDAQWGSRDV